MSVRFVCLFLSFFLSLGLVGFSSFRTKGLLLFASGTAAKPNQSPTESLSKHVLAYTFNLLFF